MSEDFVPQFGF